MKNYFDFYSAENSTSPFGLFSISHFAWLAIGAAFCAAMCIIYRKSPRKKLIRVTVSSGALILELLRAVLEMSQGCYDIYTLPLHLCGLSVYIVFLHSLRDNRRLWQFMYAFCLPGAVFALVFPDWSYYPLISFFTSAAFELHILIVTYILMLLTDRKPDIRYAPSNLLIMLAIAVPVYFFNKIAGTNYMFLNWPVMPLTLFSSLGRPAYLIGYLPIIILCWAVMYLPFIRKRK